ncbi:MAG TPA: nucleoside deaminase [bacterium]
MPADRLQQERFMVVALQEAREGLEEGERPFGSVVVHRGEIVGRGRNRAVSRRDPVLHAEIVAIRQAAQRLGLAEFGDATLYTTCEPCPMCCGAVFFAGIRRVVVGVRFATLDRFSTRIYHYRHYTAEMLQEMIGWPLEIIDGILGPECEAIFRDWEIVGTQPGR